MLYNVDMHIYTFICIDVYKLSHLLFIIPVAQLSINGTKVDSVTDRDNEPQYHVKEDAGSITLCIRLESFPEEKDNLTIKFFTSEKTASE